MSGATRPLRRIDAIACSLAALLGLGLRLYRYPTVPSPRDNPDEVQFAWAGLSLLQDHVPRSWSYFPEYGSSAPFVYRDGVIYPLVTPWLDHPPLFALLTGAAAWMGGQPAFGDVTTWTVRLPPIVLGVACVPLLYVLALRVSGRGAAVAASLLLATAPGAVLFSRAVEPEALLAPLMLGAALSVVHLLEPAAGRVWWVVLVLCCGLAPLAKVPGALIGVAAAAGLLAARRPRAALIPLASALVGLAMFAIYGLNLDWQLFLRVQAEQASHREGLMGAFEFITAPAGLNRHFRDPWWLLGWLALLWAMRGDDERLSARIGVALPVVIYAAGMLVMADSRVASFGWYRVTVYPLVYLLAAVLMWRLLREPGLIELILVLSTGAAVALSGWLGGTSFVGVASATLAGLFGAVVALVVALRWRWPQVAQWSVAATLALILAGNVWTCLRLPDLYLYL